MAAGRKRVRESRSSKRGGGCRGGIITTKTTTLANVGIAL
jgi:hypothetical protein